MKGPTAFAHFPETRRGTQLYCPSRFSPESNNPHPLLLSPHCWLGVRDLIFQVGTSLGSSPRSISALSSDGRKTPKIECRLGRKSTDSDTEFQPGTVRYRPLSFSTNKQTFKRSLCYFCRSGWLSPLAPQAWGILFCLP